MNQSFLQAEVISTADANCVQNHLMWLIQGEKFMKILHDHRQFREGKREDRTLPESNGAEGLTKHFTGGCSGRFSLLPEAGLGCKTQRTTSHVDQKITGQDPCPKSLAAYRSG
jgi:hypothetical protein